MQSPVKGHLGCFHLRATVTNASVNINICCSPCFQLFSAYTQKWNCGISRGFHVSFLGPAVLFSSSGRTILHPHPQCTGFLFSTKDTAFDHARFTLIIPLNFTNSVIKLSHIPVQQDKKRAREKKVTLASTSTKSCGIEHTGIYGTYTAAGMVTVVSSSISFSCFSRSASISLRSSSSLVS